MAARALPLHGGERSQHFLTRDTPQAISGTARIASNQADLIGVTGAFQFPVSRALAGCEIRLTVK